MPTTTMKFQIDSTGTKCLIESEDDSTFRQIDQEEIVEAIKETYELGPMDKCYAKASINKEGVLVLGKQLPDQHW